MRWLIIIPLLFFCSMGYSTETASPGGESEASFVPMGLDISESPSASSPGLGALGGIAQAITAAAGNEKNWLPDFGFVRGVDLNWDSWFAPSNTVSDEW